MCIKGVFWVSCECAAGGFVDQGEVCICTGLPRGSAVENPPAMQET